MVRTSSRSCALEAARKMKKALESTEEEGEKRSDMKIKPNRRRCFEDYREELEDVFVECHHNPDEQAMRKLAEKLKLDYDDVKKLFNRMRRNDEDHQKEVAKREEEERLKRKAEEGISSSDSESDDGEEEPEKRVKRSKISASHQKIIFHVVEKLRKKNQTLKMADCRRIGLKINMNPKKISNFVGHWGNKKSPKKNGDKRKKQRVVQQRCDSSSEEEAEEEEAAVVAAPKPTSNERAKRYEKRNASRQNAADQNDEEGTDRVDDNIPPAIEELNLDQDEAHIQLNEAQEADESSMMDFDTGVEPDFAIGSPVVAMDLPISTPDEDPNAMLKEFLQFILSSKDYGKLASMFDKFKELKGDAAKAQLLVEAHKYLIDRSSNLPGIDPAQKYELCIKLGIGCQVPGQEDMGSIEPFDDEEPQEEYPHEDEVPAQPQIPPTSTAVSDEDFEKLFFAIHGPNAKTYDSDDSLNSESDLWTDEQVRAKDKKSQEGFKNAEAERKTTKRIRKFARSGKKSIPTKNEMYGKDFEKFKHSKADQKILRMLYQDVPIFEDDVKAKGKKSLIQPNILSRTIKCFAEMCRNEPLSHQTNWIKILDDIDVNEMHLRYEHDQYENNWFYTANHSIEEYVRQKLKDIVSNQIVMNIFKKETFGFELDVKECLESIEEYYVCNPSYFRKMRIQDISKELSIQIKLLVRAACTIEKKKNEGFMYAPNMRPLMIYGD